MNSTSTKTFQGVAIVSRTYEIQELRGSSANPDIEGFLVVPRFDTHGEVVGETSMPVSERTLRRQIDEADEADASMVFVKNIPKEETSRTQ